jgi:hypothetical protein
MNYDLVFLNTLIFEYSRLKFFDGNSETKNGKKEVERFFFLEVVDDIELVSVYSLLIFTIPHVIAYVKSAHHILFCYIRLL